MKIGHSFVPGPNGVLVCGGTAVQSGNLRKDVPYPMGLFCSPLQLPEGALIILSLSRKEALQIVWILFAHAAFLRRTTKLSHRDKKTSTAIAELRAPTWVGSTVFRHHKTSSSKLPQYNEVALASRQHLLVERVSDARNTYSTMGGRRPPQPKADHRVRPKKISPSCRPSARPGSNSLPSTPACSGARR